MIQQLKTLLREQLGLPPAAILVALGLVAHLGLNFVLKKPLTSAVGLLAPLLLGIAIESWEIWVQYRDIGLTASGNDPLIVILARHSTDVVLILAGPLIVVAFGALPIRD